MKALTLWRPWQTVITRHGKRVENRDWAPPNSLLGRRFAFHSGKTIDKKALPYLRDICGDLLVTGDPGFITSTQRLIGWVHGERKYSSPPIDRSFVDLGPHGTVIVHRLEHCCEVFREDVLAGVAGPFFFGSVGWVFDQVVEMQVSCPRGHQGLWDLPEDLEQQVLAAERAAIAREEFPIGD